MAARHAYVNTSLIIKKWAAEKEVTENSLKG